MIRLIYLLVLKIKWCGPSRKISRWDGFSELLSNVESG